MLENMQDYDYDWIVIDCAPSLDIANLNALMYAQEVVIPIAVDFLAMVGARQYMETVAEAKKSGAEVHVSTILPTAVASARSPNRPNPRLAGGSSRLTTS